MTTRRIEEAFYEGFTSLQTYNDTPQNTADDAWQKSKAELLFGIAAAVAQERERCARVCEETANEAYAKYKRDADLYDDGRCDAALALAEKIRTGHPAEPQGDARDAARYRWLFGQHWVEPEARFRLNLSQATEDDAALYKLELDAAIDAAIARAEGEPTP